MKSFYVLLLLGVWLVEGCAVIAVITPYTGVYLLRESAEVTELERATDLVEQIEEAVRPFGLGKEVVLADPVETYTAFSIHNSEIHVAVVVAQKQLGIKIKDHNNLQETEFVRSLKDAIEHRVKQRYGVSISFRRVADFS